MKHLTTSIQQLTCPKSMVVIPQPNGVIRMERMHEIMYIRGDGPVTELFKAPQGRMKSIRGLAYFNKCLNEDMGYYRFSQSLIVNMAHIDHVHTRKQIVVLRNGTVLKASRRGTQQFKQWTRTFEIEYQNNEAHAEYNQKEPNNMESNNA